MNFNLTRARKATLKRIAIGIGGSALFFTAAMGGLHTKWGRPIMAKLGMKCPANTATAEQVEAMRQRGLAELRGDVRAPARPALGFQLDVTTREEALAWTAEKKLKCEIKKRGGDAIFCSDVPGDVVAETFIGSRPVDELDLMFGPDGKLVQIETMRRNLPSQEAEALFTGVIGKLTPVLGKPSEEVGDRTASYFDEGGMKTAFVKYRFSDYLVVVNAMRFHEGVAFRERYVSATQSTSPRG
jgi:hypothetical protein